MIRVIGCGNLEAGDDAAGLVAVGEARERLADAADVEVTLAGTGARVLDLIEQARGVVLVDAVRTPGGTRTPGTLVRAEVSPEGLPAEVSASLSSHGLGLAEVIGINAALGSPAPVIFLGVEASDATLGHPLSPEVAAAIPELVDRVVGEAMRLARAEAP